MSVPRGGSTLPICFHNQSSQSKATALPGAMLARSSQHVAIAKLSSCRDAGQVQLLTFQSLEPGPGGLDVGMDIGPDSMAD